MDAEGHQQALARADQIREVLRSGTAIEDDTFDLLYARPLQELSEMHWTPVAVALRAATLLAPEPGIRVLDVGAGCGKLCCVGALVTTALWQGVEREPDLVAAAYRTAIFLGVDHRMSFITGDVTAVDWSAFDSLYFFNPFEAAPVASGLIDEPVEQSARWRQFCDEVELTENRLAELPAGTRVVTYHGFGGQMPKSYSLTYHERIGADYLSLWVKSSNARSRRIWLASA